jgi:hypothetical protein
VNSVVVCSKSAARNIKRANVVKNALIGKGFW